MKRVTMLLLLTLAVSLSAIVNLGDEYIGSTPMGPFRKTKQSDSNWSGYATGSADYFFYDEENPTRLIRIERSYSYPDGSSYSKVYFEYLEFDDHREMVESYYLNWQDDWGEGTDGYELQYTKTYTYDLQDKLLEYNRVSLNYGNERCLYGYDDNDNLVTETLYRSYESETEPARVITYGYDVQNRLNYKKEVESGQTRLEIWQTWGDYPLPDSTYTWKPNDRLIQKHYFDENGQRHYQQQWYKLASSSSWRRTDILYQYILAHQIYFPLSVNSQTAIVESIDAPFVPESTTVDNYVYTNDYHHVSITQGRYTITYEYDDNWLLTKHDCRDSEHENSYTRNFAWQQYATPNDDPTAVPQAVVTAYPNPARGNVNISLNKSSSPAPAEAKVYNVRGQLVRRLEVSDTRGDQYLYNWDCKDSNSHAVPAGVYLIRIKTNSGEVNKKVTVIK
ncbi:MAG: T9SS type A sorting domain-containing protein [Candidatus Cloacimonadaceae bacterium]|jgi:hypothetical protein